MNKSEEITHHLITYTVENEKSNMKRLNMSL